MGRGGGRGGEERCRIILIQWRNTRVIKSPDYYEAREKRKKERTNSNLPKQSTTNIYKFASVMSHFEYRCFEPGFTLNLQT